MPPIFFIVPLEPEIRRKCMKVMKSGRPPLAKTCAYSTLDGLVPLVTRYVMFRLGFLKFFVTLHIKILSIKHD